MEATMAKSKSIVSCEWMVLHRLTNWQDNLKAEGHDRREKCGHTAKIYFVKVGSSRVKVALCGMHKTGFVRRGVSFS